jgi:hypothetical protein
MEADAGCLKIPVATEVSYDFEQTRGLLNEI